ncbi:hypothetical protein BDV28DRAFT_127601 [Aspergillus coremiiformis]|uniref:Uncharacterized protein n=1 Tax=Aspergillus coremiiformis TaxID=138285 RepID=A0A5N6ZFP2_9EURO|nr:hypothetical protein BDV28DRAFT_127601 [Aspergillus coremiiformis]
MYVPWMYGVQYSTYMPVCIYFHPTVHSFSKSGPAEVFVCPHREPIGRSTKIPLLSARNGGLFFLGLVQWFKVNRTQFNLVSFKVSCERKKKRKERQCQKRPFLDLNSDHTIRCVRSIQMKKNSPGRRSTCCSRCHGVYLCIRIESLISLFKIFLEYLEWVTAHVVVFVTVSRTVRASNHRRSVLSVFPEFTVWLT